MFLPTPGGSPALRAEQALVQRLGERSGAGLILAEKPRESPTHWSRMALEKALEEEVPAASLGGYTVGEVGT